MDGTNRHSAIDVDDITTEEPARPGRGAYAATNMQAVEASNARATGRVLPPQRQVPATSRPPPARSEASSTNGRSSGGGGGEGEVQAATNGDQDDRTDEDGMEEDTDDRGEVWQFWTPPPSTTACNLRFVLRKPQSADPVTRGMVWWRVDGYGKKAVSGKVKLRTIEGSGLLGSEWVKVSADGRVDISFYYEFRAQGRSGRHTWREQPYCHTINVLAGRRTVLRFEVLEGQLVAEKPAWQRLWHSDVLATASPRYEQLGWHLWLVARAPDAAMWAFAANQLLQKQILTFQENLRRYAHLTLEPVMDDRAPFWVETTVFYLGAAGGDIGRAELQQVAKSVLAPAVSSSSLRELMSRRDSRLADSLERGFKLLASAAARGGSYAWLHLLLLQLDVSVFASAMKAEGLRALEERSAEYRTTCEAVLPLIPKSRRELEAYHALLNSAPTPGDRIFCVQLLVSCGRDQTGIERFLRLLQLQDLVALALLDELQPQEKEWARQAFVSRASQYTSAAGQPLDLGDLQAAVQVLGFRMATQIKQLVQALLSNEALRPFAIHVILDPKVIRCFYFDDPYPVHAVEEWVARTSGRDPVEHSGSVVHALEVLDAAGEGVDEERHRKVGGALIRGLKAVLEGQPPLTLLQMVKTLPGRLDEVRASKTNVTTVSKAFLELLSPALQNYLDTPGDYLTACRHMGLLRQGGRPISVETPVAQSAVDVVLTTFHDRVLRPNPEALALTAQLLNYSEFWSQVLCNAPDGVAGDAAFVKVDSHVRALLISILDTRIITVGQLRRLVALPGFRKSMASYAEVLYPSQATEAAFEGLLPTLTAFQETLDALETFLNVFCDGSQLTEKPWRPADFDMFIAELRLLRDGYEHFSLRDVAEALAGGDGVLWGRLAAVLAPALRYATLHASSVVRNAWLQEVEAWMAANGGHGPWVATLCSELCPAAIDRRVGDFLHMDACLSALSLQEVWLLWKDVTSVEMLDAELSLLAAFFSVPQQAANALHETLLVFVTMEEVRRNLNAMEQLLGQLGRDEATSGVLAHVGSLGPACDVSNFSSIKLSALVEGVVDFRQATASVWDAMPVFRELAAAADLVSFVKEIIDEENLNLIDSVEEHGDSFIRPETVSDLDMVRRLLKAPLKDTSLQDLEALESVREQALKEAKGGHTERTDDQLTTVASRVKQCGQHAHSLRDLFKRLSHRQELTKTIIARLLSAGQLTFERIDGVYNVVAVWTGPDGRVQRYDKEHLQDLKGRALLQLNSYDRTGAKQNEDASINLQDFCETVQLAVQMVSSLALLDMLGHFGFRKYSCNTPVRVEDVRLMLTEIGGAIKSWSTELESLRNEYYELNFFFSQQLWMLYDFLTGVYDPDSRETAACASLLRFAARSMETCHFAEWHGLATVDGVEETKGGDRPVNELLLSNDPLLKLRGLAVMVSCMLQASAEQAPEKLVRPADSAHHSLFMTCYSNERDLYPSIFGLFDTMSEVQALRRSCLLICDESTVVEELRAFAKRVFSPSHPTCGLFCVVNGHSMSHERRMLLTEAIVEAYEARHSDTDAVLVFLVPDAYRSYQEELSFRAHKINALTPARMRTILQGLRPKVLVVDALQAGAGKTEFIKFHADENYQRRMCTIAIGDTVTRTALVTKLARVVLRPDECYHFDVSALDDVRGVSLALFELLALGSLQVGTSVLDIPGEMICYIEVAYAPADGLRQSLHLLDCFQGERVCCGTDTLIVSQELTSDMQIVCNYLQKLAAGTLSCETVTTSGPNKNVRAVPQMEARQLLLRYFYAGLETMPSFNVLYIFLGVLADQLRKFSISPYFDLEIMRVTGLEGFAAVRGEIVANLVQLCRDFAVRSVADVRQRQGRSLQEEKLGSEFMTRGLVRWEDTTQMMALLQPAGSLTAIYRDIKDVDDRLRQLLESQMNEKEKLPDYKAMTDPELREQLSRFSILPPDQLGPVEYAVTPDNFLKMVMIMVRVDAGLPVIVMGETGCGKTSLIQFVAMMKGARVETFNVHAGVTEEQIYEHITRCEALPEDQQVWVFLDEINTCNHLGMINRLICHRMIDGRPVARHLAFFAACNPYRLKPNEGITAGLDLQQKRKPDKLSRLVYRVYPLPETMLDYLWDFGSLSAGDEEDYISRVLMGLASDGLLRNSAVVDLLVQLEVEAHRFIRAREDPSAVSMRDVRRCKLLTEWFVENKRCRPLPRHRLLDYVPLDWSKQWKRELDELELSHACVVLAIPHCYRSRLPMTELRHEFDDVMAGVFSRHGLSAFTPDRIRVEISREQHDYLQRMDLGLGIAVNDALLENIFVLVVCILLKMPVFLVGKPGSSKTLAMKRIEAHLRGRDSKDDFFKLLNEVKVVSYQGSVSSTSEGVLLAFSKAKSYADVSENTTVVVLIDEVGLAELSPANPLKVLHSLFEYSDFRHSQGVAVVGISNWSLDAAKMNRAIHIARPDPDEEALFKTSQEVLRSLNKAKSPLHNTIEFLKLLSAAYVCFYKDQLMSTKHANFHGLRDFYSAVKHIGLQGGVRVTLHQAAQALARNFGGLPQGPLTPFDDLTTNVTRDPLVCSVKGLVHLNLQDSSCRHLMILTTGDAVLSALDGLFKERGLPSPRILIGSKLRGDRTEAYHYRLLSEVIECMESGTSLVLKDLDPVYGSLYDMLNQAYTPIAGRMHCRVALGAWSNPMCHVHEAFKCVVVVEATKAELLDPPFLNRFEKQRVDLSSLLTPRQHIMLRRLRKWTDDISTMQHSSRHAFGPRDMFLRFGSSTLESLVASLPDDVDDDTGLAECQRQLVCLTPCDGIVRVLASRLAAEDSEQAHQLFDAFFRDPAHASLAGFTQACLLPAAMRGVCTKSVVTTFTALHFFSPDRHLIPELAGKHITLRLAAFETESSLADRIRRFYEEEQALLILECDALYDRDNMLLAKFIVDRAEHDSMKDRASTNTSKHALFLVHVSRSARQYQREDQGEDDVPEPAETEAAEAPWEVCFSRGWLFQHIDNLLLPEAEWDNLRTIIATDRITDVLQRPGLFEEMVSTELVGCFSQLRYGQVIGGGSEQEQAERIRRNARALAEKPGLLGLMQGKIEPAVMQAAMAADSNARWVINVATDRELLELCLFSLANAIPVYMNQLVHKSLTKLVYLLEQSSTFDAYTEVELRPGHFFHSAFEGPKMLDSTSVKSLPLNQSYEVERTVLGLRFPFSARIVEALSEERLTYFSDLEKTGGIESEQGATAVDMLISQYYHRVRLKLDTTLKGMVDETAAAQTGFWGTDAESPSGVLWDARYVSDVLTLAVQSTGAIADTSRLVHLAGQVTTALGKAAGKDLQDPVRLHVLLWQHWPLIQAMLDLMDCMPGQGAQDEFLEGLGQFGEEQGTSEARLLAYQLACAGCREHLQQICVSGQNLRACVSGLDQFLSRASALARAASITMDREQAELDPTLELLDRLFVLRVIRDLAAVATSTPVSFLEGAAEWLHMDEALLQRTAQWLGEQPAEIQAAAAEALSSVLERFLFVASERFNSGLEGEEGSFAESSFFSAILARLADLAANPSVYLKRIVTLVLREATDAIEQACEETGEQLTSSIIMRELPAHTEGSLAIFNALERVRGSPLEVLLLDVITETMIADMEETRMQDRGAAGAACEVFERAALNVLKGEKLPWLTLLLSQAYIREFLRVTSRQLREGSISDEQLGAINWLGNLATASMEDRTQVHHWRMYLLKQVEDDYGKLAIDCGEDGRLSMCCPWLAQLGIHVAGKNLLTFNVFKDNEFYAEASEAWEQLHERPARSADALSRYIDATLALSDDSLAVERMEALAASVFMHMCNLPRAPYTPAEEADLLLQKTATSFRSRIQTLGTFALKAAQGFATDGFFSPGDEDGFAHAFLTSLVLHLVSAAVRQPENLLSHYVFNTEALTRTSLVPGAESNEEGQLMRALQLGEVMRYMCACGVMYWVGECGETMEEISCSCGRMLGGRNHQHNHDQRKIDGQKVSVEAMGQDQLGYFFPAVNAEREGATVRNLTPVMYWLVCLLVHAAAFAAILLRDEKGPNAEHDQLAPQPLLHC